MEFLLLKSGLSLSIFDEQQYVKHFNEIQAYLTADRLLIVKMMHEQKFVFGKIPNPVFKHGVFKYVDPFEFTTQI